MSKAWIIAIVLKILSFTLNLWTFKLGIDDKNCKYSTRSFVTIENAILYPSALFKGRKFSEITKWSIITNWLYQEKMDNEIAQEFFVRRILVLAFRVSNYRRKIIAIEQKLDFRGHNKRWNAICNSVILIAFHGFSSKF